MAGLVKTLVKKLRENPRANFSNIKSWKNVTEEVLVTNHSDTNIDNLRAKSAELENWQKHHAYEKVDDTGQTIVFVSWVVSQKYKNEDVTYKEKLVAQGFEE